MGLGWACIAVPVSQGVPHRDDDAGLEGFTTLDAASSPTDTPAELGPADPHRLMAISPSHGPFTGGVRSVVRGAGFLSTARVWFGETEVPAGDTLVVDPKRIQVTTPPGMPGPCDVRVQNGDDVSTSRLLPSAFVFDAFHAEPSSGPTAGGTLLTLRGSKTQWDASTTVHVGGKPCGTIAVKSHEELTCVSPSHPAGSVSISIVSAGEQVQLDDAYIYADSDNGFKAGLSGNPLSGTLRVMAIDSAAGKPLAKAIVLVGYDSASLRRATTDATGVALVQDPSLVGKRTVTIARPCYQPITYVDVPVDTVTAVLDPILTMDCASDAGDLPSWGGRSANPATIHGELVWQGGVEFRPANWNNVPGTKSPDEQAAAYVFAPTSDSSSMFQLPDKSQAVTPTSGGTIGYGFDYVTGAGNMTLYAFAGIENRSVYPPRFTPYAFGITRSVVTQPGQTTSEVFIRMDTQLDQAIRLLVEGPTPGPRGPDRIKASVAIQVATDNYVIIPGAQRILPLVPSTAVSFVGIPSLDASLGGARYVSGASAITGEFASTPLSMVQRVVSTDPSVDVPITGFVQVPVLRTPATAERFDGQHLELSIAPGGMSIDVLAVRIRDALGLQQWSIVAPGRTTSIHLPDLSSVGMPLRRGTISIEVQAGHVADITFDYGKLLSRHTTTAGWTAYAHDVFQAQY